MSEPIIIRAKNGCTATLYCGDCLEILPTLGKVDAVITDPPFSARTHDGHRASASGAAGEGNDGAARKPLGYASWGADVLDKFIRAADAACSGWLVVFNDHTNAPRILRAMDECGRYSFAPLPFYAPGSTCRLSGDGPSSWTTWIMVSRTPAQHRWGTLPGGYVRERGWDSATKMGGKPVPLMQAIIADYSKLGSTVCDPCMGEASTGVAALREGRSFTGIEIDPAAFAIARRRIEAEAAQAKLFTEPAAPKEQRSIL